MSALAADRPFEGHIALFGDKFVLDAAPYVMLMARACFKGARPYPGNGVFGKMPLIMTITVDGSSVHIVDPTANSLRGGS